MGLRDMLRKKEDGSDSDAPGPSSSSSLAPAPPVTFIRSDTVSQEVIYPPSHPIDDDDRSSVHTNDQYLNPAASGGQKPRRSLDVFRTSRSRSGSTSSRNSDGTSTTKKRLSERLHLHRAPASSENVPDNLPEIVVRADEDAENQWEERATMLAGANERSRSRPATPVYPQSGGGLPQSMSELSLGLEERNPRGDENKGRHRSRSVVSSKEIDADIQEAIRLHEEGDLERSTRLFGQLADPRGANNPLSQVLYGLALRHGWGCAPDPAAAVTYLSKAASNAADVESLALQAGLKKGGAAKGELVLAIFELANCFRHGWGIPKDAIAAKQYYETAANLGDTDAMNEAAWCYLEGFGCKKDKFAAARYYRLAEKNGSKTLGNSWIWKEKYDPPEAGGKK